MEKIDLIDPKDKLEDDVKRSVLIIYTGGTLGMKPNSEGSLEPVPGYLVEIIRGMPEMHTPEMPRYDIIEYDPLLDSSSMGPSDWIKIAKDIEENYFKYDGFVVGMGTDTMAYAASALSFMLENLGKPVIFTGSLIPQFEVYSDARRNLLVSILFAVSCDIPEVCICFNDILLRGNRTTKVNSVGMTAFDSPNYPHLAILGTVVKYRRHLALHHPRLQLKIHKKMFEEILVIKLVPGFSDKAFFNLLGPQTKDPGVRAIVLELYGTGNAPSHKETLLTMLDFCKKRDIIVVAVSQCLKGAVSLETYALGRELQRRGVISCSDMTTEACVTKISYLYGRKQDTEYVKRFLAIDLRGEMSKQSFIGNKFLSEVPNESLTISKL